MNRIRLSVLVLSAVLLVASQARSVPLHPRVVQKLAEYDRLEAWTKMAEDAAARGMGRMPPGGPVLTAERPAATLRAVALLVAFPDRPVMPSYEPERYERSLFRRAGKKGGSVSAFYALQSDEALDFQGEVYGWFELPEKQEHYAAYRAGIGEYPGNLQGLVEDAVALAADTVPFDRFDAFGPDPGRGDGVVDILVVIHSARGMESTGELDDLWSHSGTLPAPVTVRGVRVDHYIVAPLDASVGPLAYEVARTLGVPDLGDPSYRWSGPGTWSLMGSGMWTAGRGENPALLDAYSRVHLGFATAVDVPGRQLEADLGCDQNSPPVFRLYPGGTPGPEYFLVECRRRFRFDQNLPGEGVLIYHVDERVPENRFFCCGPGGLHALVAVEQADGKCELERGLPAEANDLWARFEGARFVAQDFDEYSRPDSHDYRGERTGVAVRRFRMEGDRVTADLFVDLPPDPERVPGMSVEMEGISPQGRDAVIHVQLARPARVHVLVRNPVGEVVWEREVPLAQAGRVSFRWDASAEAHPPEGTYFVEARTTEWWDVRRITFP